VDEWWVLFCSDVWMQPSFGWRHWLSHLGGIVKVVFGLRPRLAPNVGIK
jgi:hypothetical protein